MRYEAGERSATLAVEYDCTSATIIKAVKRQGGKVGPPKPPRTAHVPIKDALRRYAAGASMSELAHRYEVSRWVIQHRLLENGVDLRTADRQRGPEHYRWKGGRHRTTAGYIRVWMAPDHPFASTMRSNDGTASEHRLVMAEFLGRPLTRRESVHHLDGDRQNNQIENLQLRTRSHGQGVITTCLDCGSRNIGHHDL